VASSSKHQASATDASTTKPATGVDQVLRLQATERLAFAELLQLGDNLADLVGFTGTSRAIGVP
jgi:hypothetical protein